MQDLARIRQHLDLLPETLLVADTNGIILTANTGALHQLGTLNLELGKTSLIELCGSSKTQFAEYLRTCSRTSSFIPSSITLSPPVNLSYRVEGAMLEQRSGSSPALLLLRLTPKPAALSRFIALNMQVARLSGEIERRRRAEAELAQQREYLQATLGCIADAVIAFDTGGHITLFNAAAEQHTGWTAQQALGQPVDSVVRIVEESSRQPLTGFLAVEQPTSRGCTSAHLLLVRKNGEQLAISASAAPIRDAAGQMIGRVLVLQDISERRRMEQKIERDNHELEESNRRKDEFLAMLGHELRNPLAPIKTAADILALSGATNERQQLAIEIIERQLGHLVGLVDQILDIARVSTGRIALKNEPIDVSKLIQQAAELCAPLFEAKQQSFRASLPDRPVFVQGDAQRLTQALGNLLNNASKYNSAGGSIWVRAQELGPRVVITVRDNGTGIAPEVMPHIFDLFYQSERTLDRAGGGLGLGLTLVRKLVEQHGGSIEAYSDGIGKGSEFRLQLPAASPPTASVARNPVPAAICKSLACKVLVIDDNRDAAATLQEMMRMLGHEAISAYDGEEGIALALQQLPQVIFLDIGMPQRDGYEVARLLRAHDKMRNTVLVALTGYGQRADLRKSQDAGFDHHLIKPASLEAIGNVLAVIQHRLLNQAP